MSLDTADPKLGAVRADGSMPLTVSYVVTDARGSGAGWSLQATFTSADAVAYPTLETLHNLNGEANLPQTPALPASLTSTTTSSSAVMYSFAIVSMRCAMFTVSPMIV